MKDNRSTEQVFDLLNSKSFEELNSEERALVSAEMTEEEYRSTRELLLNAGDVAKQTPLQPSERIKLSLLDEYDKRYKRKKPAIAFLFASVPLYSAAAAVIIAIVAMAAWHYVDATQILKEPSIVYKVKTDTVYLLADTTTSRPQVASSSENSLPSQKQETKEDASQEKGASATLCRSIKTDSSLKHFMVASL